MGKKNLSIYHKVAFFLYPPAINTQENDIYKIKNFILTKMEELYFSYFSQQTPTTSDSPIAPNPHSPTKDTRITRCVTPYDFLAHDFFAVALEVAPGSLEFLLESEERYSEQLFSTHTVIADNFMCAHVCSCIVNLTKYALHLRSSLTLNLYYF